MIVGALFFATVYLIIERSVKKEEDKSKKKKQMNNKIQVTFKVFASDDSVGQYMEEPSTTIRAESSGK